MKKVLINTTAAKRFKQLFAQVVEVNPEQLRMDAKLKNIPQWDSIAAVSLLVMMQTEYNKNVTAEDIRQAKTINDLYRLIRRDT